VANIDLSGYNLGELKGLQRDIEQAIKDRQQQDVQKAREEIMAIAKNAGVSVEDLLAGASKKASKASGKKVQAQFQNPKDAAQTWTGRGRQPKWIAEGLAKGKALDDFRMK
jgi:DNA-binding protein H-NS